MEVNGFPIAVRRGGVDWTRESLGTDRGRTGDGLAGAAPAARSGGRHDSSFPGRARLSDEQGQGQGATSNLRHNLRP